MAFYLSGILYILEASVGHMLTTFDSRVFRVGRRVDVQYDGLAASAFLLVGDTMGLVDGSMGLVDGRRRFGGLSFGSARPGIPFAHRIPS